MSDLSKSKGHSFAMERMMAKDEEDRLERVNTKQKRGTPTRDIGLQKKVLFWIMDLLEEKPKGKIDYDHWISDGTILIRVLQSVMFNSVPIDVLTSPKPLIRNDSENHQISTSSPDSKSSHNGSGNHQELLTRANTEERVKVLLKYLKRFGLPEKYLFDLDDLVEMKNMPKVTRCIAMLAKMSGSKSFSDCTIEIPNDDPDKVGSDND